VAAEEQVRRSLEGIEGVAAIRVTGGLVEEILVEVDERRLAQLGIPFAQVARRLEAENINLAGGVLEEGDAQYVVRTVNEFADLDEMLRVVVGTAGGQPILLADVAEVRREAEERETISLVDGREAVEIAVLRESTANIVALSRVVRDRIETEPRGRAPRGGPTTLVSDQATFIERAVGDVGKAALFGGIFAMLVLLLFLRHFPTTLIVATAIPISVVATFVLMFSRDITLNIMSLGGWPWGSECSWTAPSWCSSPWPGSGTGGSPRPRRHGMARRWWAVRWWPPRSRRWRSSSPSCSWRGSPGSSSGPGLDGFLRPPGVPRRCR
jgi:hydrophobic/amphiphilic exporter-1 (mainly G- bacteria), HAE1 family